MEGGGVQGLKQAEEEMDPKEEEYINQAFEELYKKDKSL